MARVALSSCGAAAANKDTSLQSLLEIDSRTAKTHRWGLPNSLHEDNPHTRVLSLHPHKRPSREEHLCSSTDACHPFTLELSLCFILHAPHAIRVRLH